MPATYSKPTKINEWADTGVVVEPSEAKKDSGWVAPELPPDTFFNWWQNLSGNWTKWFDERMADGASADEWVLKNPDTGGEVMRLMTISGVNGIRYLADANVTLRKTGTSEIVWGVDANDSFEYDQVDDHFRWTINSVIEFQLQSGGGWLKGGLVIGTDALTPGQVVGNDYKMLQFAKPGVPATNGEFWMGYQVGDEMIIMLDDSLGTYIDGFLGSVRLFAGSSAYLVGVNGTNDCQIPGNFTQGGSLENGAVLIQKPAVLATDGFVKIGNDNFRLEAPNATAGGVIHWDFANGEYLEYLASANDYRFYWNSVNKLILGEFFLFDLTNSYTLGGQETAPGVGFFLKQINVQEVVLANGIAYSALPGSPGNPPHRLRAQTTPFCVCPMAANGVTPTNLVHNVASTTRTAAGEYLINTHIPTQWGRLNVQVTPNTTGSVGSTATGKKSTAGPAIVTNTYLAGTRTDTEHNVVVYDGGWII